MAQNRLFERNQFPGFSQMIDSKESEKNFRRFVQNRCVIEGVVKSLNGEAQ